MPVSDVYGQFAPQVHSVADFQNALAQQQSNQLALQKGNLDLQSAQATFGRQNALMAAYRGGADPTTPEGRAQLIAADPLSAPKIFQQQADLAKTNAETTKFTGQGAEANQKVAAGKLDIFHQQLGGVTDPNTAAAYVNRGYDDPTLGPMMGGEQGRQAALASIPQDPNQIPAWRAQKDQEAIAAKDRMTNAVTQRGQDMTQQTALTTTGMNNATSTANTAANNRTSIQTTGMTNATSRANTTANISKDYAINGMNPDGSPSDAMQGTINGIANGQLAPLTGNALSHPMGLSVMGRVLQANPGYDTTVYGAKAGAMKSFAEGVPGQNVQSANIALNHIATIEQLAQAQKNGDMKAFNNIANQIGSQFGQAAPTNLKAAIAMVAPEITRSTVGAGGGVTDRDKTFETLDTSYSPDQLLGATGVIKELLGGRLVEIGRNYGRTTGRSDFNSPAMLSPAAQAIYARRSAASSGASDSGLSVSTPDGQVHTFPNATSAAAFKKAAGL